MNPFVAALMAELQQDDEGRRELAGILRPYLDPQSDGTDEIGDRLLDAREKAAQLGLHPDTLGKMARAGRISAVKIGREWRFRASDLPETGRRAADDRTRAALTGKCRSAIPASVAAIRGR